MDLFNYNFYANVKEVKGSADTASLKMKGLDSDATRQQKIVGTHFKSIKRRYNQSAEYFTTEDFIQEYSILFYQASLKLEVLEPLEVLLSDDDIYKQRIGFIKQDIDREMIRVANPETQVVRSNSTRKYVDIDIQSYDISVSEDSDYTMKDVLGEENNLYKTHKHSYNHFITWTLENYENILTAKQSKIFARLLEIYQPLTDRSKSTLQARSEMLEEIGITNTNINRMFKTIKKRCVEAYTKEFGKLQSHISVQSKHLHEVLNNYVNQANNPNWSTQEARQRELNRIISKEYDNETFELIIIKGLNVNEIIEIVRGVKGVEMPSNKVLRKVRQNIEDYLSKNEQLYIDPSINDFIYKEDSFQDITKAKGKSFRILPSGNVYENNDGKLDKLN